MSEPLKIVYLDPETDKFVFDEQIYSQMLFSNEAIEENIRDLPVAIVSISGDTRKGKSFLLNFLLRYLSRYDQDDWIGDLNEPLTGFSWKSGVESVTDGIVLWPKPFIIKRKDGSRIIVLLMDTQGFFDDRTNCKAIEQFYTISTVVSSIQIYNQMRNLQSNDVTNLSKFSEYAKKVSANSGVKPFQRLLLLVRDWANSSQYDFGLKGGRSFLLHKMESQQDNFRSKWSTLNECFSDVDCFLMPSLGDESEEPEFNGEIGKLKPQFVEALKKLVPELLSPDKIVTKKIQGEEIPFYRIFNLLHELTEQLEKFESIEIGKLKSMNNTSKVEDAFQLAKLYFLDKIFEVSQQKQFNISSVCDEAEEAAIGLYQEETKFIEGGELEDLSDTKMLELIKFFANVRDHFDKKDKSNSIAKWAVGIGSTVAIAASLAKLFLMK